MYLNTHSYFSLRYGLLSPEELVAAAAERGVEALALTDINNTSACYPFIRACGEAGIRPVLGIEFREGKDFRYIGLARNTDGFRRLCALLTRCSAEDRPIPRTPPPMEDVFFIYRSCPKPLKDFTPCEFLGVRPEELNRLHGSEALEQRDRLVAFQPVCFRHKADYNTHQLLRCIDQNIVIGMLDRKNDCASPRDTFRPPGELREAYQLYPDLLQRAEELLRACDISWTTGPQNNRRTFTGEEGGDYELLCKLTRRGRKRRYGEKHERSSERLEKELRVIRKQGFCSYFLITWDIVRYGQSMGYYHVGRGSGANSIAAYCLGITDVDPLELDLYFERFINPHRSSPPDFDIDFSWDERDDVTDYVFKRYGPKHTALLATYNTFKGRSIIRELGKVFGLPKADIDTIVRHPTRTEDHHPYAEHIFKYGKRIEGFPNYLSIHAGGILISERPLNEYTALRQMPKGFPITHFDMYTAEDMGFHKYDVLSQRGLGHIKDAIDLVEENKGRRVEIHDIRRIKRDEQVRTTLQSGHCLGCFYIESPAMRGLLSKLQCDTYVHLVAASSIIRPGVAKSGMMREYIKRFHDPDSFSYLHPVFEEHLGETFGVMVYQEDVMKICHHFSGLPMDECDVLRRIMTGKRKSGDTFARLRDKYFRNCRQKGYDEELIREVWRQISSFSGYSFCKAHSASFAVESFQSLYLKSYYPLEFMVAVINNFGGFYRTEIYFHEARMLGGNIHAPCVNNSRYLTHLRGDDIYVGWVHVRELERKVARRIVAERRAEGPYRSLEDFVQRVDISTEQLDILIRVGAFRFTGRGKCELMWEKSAVHNPSVQRSRTPWLFREQSEEYEMPVLEDGRYDQAFDEIELLGFPLCSPFALLQTDDRGEVLAEGLEDAVGQTVEMIAYFVTRKNVTTVNKKLMNFGTWLDAEGDFFDTTHFPPVLKQYPFRGQGCYRLRGKVVEDFGFPSMEVTQMEKIPYVKDERY